MCELGAFSDHFDTIVFFSNEAILKQYRYLFKGDDKMNNVIDCYWLDAIVKLTLC